jgi:putative aldouronate transport system permease protein
MMMSKYKSERSFPFFNSLVLLVVSLSMIAPLIHLLAVSLSSPIYANAKLVSFWPRGFNLTTYKEIMMLDALWRSFGVTLYMCVMGTLIFILFTSSMAYALSRPMMPMRTWVLKGILVTFVFTSPLIPNYMLINSLGLDNTLWSLMLPTALTAFYVIVMKTFMQGIALELFDAAKIDGSSEFGTLVRIAIPLSKPVIATLGLFHVVNLWNAYFHALIYIRDKELFPLQVVLRSLIIEDGAETQVMLEGGMANIPIPSTPEQLKAGIIIVATIPILFVYPFIQKHFVKGAMLGSLKE